MNGVLTHTELTTQGHRTLVFSSLRSRRKLNGDGVGGHRIGQESCHVMSEWNGAQRSGFGLDFSVQETGAVVMYISLNHPTKAKVNTCGCSAHHGVSSRHKG